MAQKNRPIKHDESRRPAPKSRAPLVILLVLILVISPVLYESGLICYSNWKSMLGANYSVRTPVLDSLTDVYRESRFLIERKVLPALHSGRWKPSTAVPIALLIAATGVLLLRKGH